MAQPEALSEVCHAVCRAHGWELLPTGILVRWGDGRHQLVSIEFFEFEREQLLRLFSLIGRFSASNSKRVESALRANIDFAHGALAVRGDELCLVDTLLLADAGAETLAAVVEYLARTADEYERLLFHEDTH